MEKVIIDTDIGTDVDDAIAIALAVKSGVLKVEGITTVYGNTLLRAKLAKKLLQLAGFKDIPVYAGSEQTLLRNRNVSWRGLETDGVMDSGSMDADEGKAVDFIIRTVMDNPGQITIVTIGALTNIAAAIIHEPQLIHNMKGIMMMGGYARTGTLPEGINPIDSNVICDPEAASVVFRSGVPITMVGLDVTYWTAIHREVFRAAFTPGNLLHTALFDLLERWLAHLKKDTAFMHDPFAVAVLIDRTLVKTKKMRVEVEYDHRPKTGTTVATPDEDGNVDVCYELDNDRFRELLLNTLAKS